MKTCIDCKFCDPNAIGDKLYPRCKRPVSTNLVTGEPSYHQFEFCSTQRLEAWFPAWVFGTCGKRGRYFEQKSPYQYQASEHAGVQP